MSSYLASGFSKKLPLPYYRVEPNAKDLPSIKIILLVSRCTSRTRVPILSLFHNLGGLFRVKCHSSQYLKDSGVKASRTLLSLDCAFSSVLLRLSSRKSHGAA